ncbi:MAG: hypothetical protein K0V04_06865 [Deltaproteobacteria bacterium]|nr:hypothetical protein [Deltaproteobacteria bacterium]
MTKTTLLALLLTSTACAGAVSPSSAAPQPPAHPAPEAAQTPAPSSSDPSTTAAQLPHDAAIEVTAFASFSGAEMFTVRIHADGTVRWHGGDAYFVAKTGEAVGQANVADVADLWHAAETLLRTRRGELDACERMSTDAARTVVRVKGAGTTFEVVDIGLDCETHGVRQDLRALVERVHVVADTEGWIHGDDARRMAPRLSS